MIKFGMGNTLLTFVDKYYEYGGDLANNNNQDTRTVRFCLGMSKGWNNSIHTILKELRNKHGLTWLRISMSYHKFPNLREIFQGDLNRKETHGWNCISGFYGSTLQLQPCLKN